MQKRFFAILLAFVILSALAVPAFADGGATASAVVKGNEVTITIKDGDQVFTKAVDFLKNTTQTYDVDGYTVQIEYNGNGVKSVKILGAPAPTSDTNAPAPKPGLSVSGDDMTWNAYDQAAAKAFKQSAAKDKVIPETAVVPTVSMKQDASGDKIPANAHSGDFPGIYFYWNDQQKDDGILKVDPDIFNLFKDSRFYITAKNSNAYWDYWIDPSDPKAVATSEGYLLYQIPRYFMYLDKNDKTTNDELKNINMIFIGGDYKDAYLIIDKDWFDEEGNLIADVDLVAELNMKLSFNNGKLTLGHNTIEINDYQSAFFGKKVTVAEDSIPGYQAKENPIKVTVKWDDDPVPEIKFENQKQWACIKIDKQWDLLPGTQTPKALFNIYDEDGDLIYEKVGPGSYNVKEGTYKVVEVGIAGFAPDKEESVITIEAGETATVEFINVEDRAHVNPVKIWIGDPLPAGVKATLTNGYAFGETTAVRVGANVVFKENDIAAVTPGDGYIYTFEFVELEITVNGGAPSVSDKNEVNFIANKDDVIVITFTNKVTKTPLPAELTIVKVWLDEEGKPLSKTGVFATVDDDISFTSPYILGTNADVAYGLDLATIQEGISECVYEDDEFWYEFDQVGVVGNTGIVAPGGNYTITFTNKLVKTLKLTSIAIEKVWTDKDSNILTNAALLAELHSRLSFTNGYTLGGPVDIDAGAISFQENPINEFVFNDVTYVVSFKSATVSEAGGKPFANVGDVVRGVNFVAENGQQYIVTFVNEVDTKTFDTGEDFIPSKEHFDRWWNHGVLCYSSSTGSDTDYFVAFDAGFWNRNEYAIIGFGNNAGSIDYEAYFDQDGWVITETSNGAVVQSGTYDDPFRVPADMAAVGHYFSGGAGYWGGYADTDLLGCDFRNVFGSGGRQAYRLTVKPLVSPNP